VCRESALIDYVALDDVTMKVASHCTIALVGIIIFVYGNEKPDLALKL